MTKFLDTCYDAIKKQEQAIPKSIDAVDEKAVSNLEGKRQIILTGCGDSFAAAHYGKWAFLRIGYNALAVSPDEIEYLRLNEDSVVIGITASGRSLATIEALQKAKSQGAEIVVLTDNRDGTASQEADHIWTTKSGVETYNTSPSAPTTAAMAYLLAISSRVDEADGDLAQNIKQLKSTTSDMISWAEKEGIGISQITSPGVPIYLISEGPNHVATQVGMMKFNEYSILKGISAIKEEFRHHYNISVNDGDCAVLVTKNPIDQSNHTYMKVLRDSLKMSVYHLYVDDKLGLTLPLVQAIPNTIALQMAAYHTVLKFNPNKESFKLPHAEAFKIY
jgi:glucosamine 6-phosphate synthetase-like amidotransferase/phosphosugar isomerase protein